MADEPTKAKPTPCCANCVFSYVHNNVANPTKVFGSGAEQLLFCRRYPPQYVPWMKGTTTWTLVADSLWCGEFILDEQKQKPLPDIPGEPKTPLTIAEEMNLRQQPAAPPRIPGR